MKKTILYAFAAAAALFCCLSCNLAEQRATEAAQNFLQAFNAMDYETAVLYCTPQFAEILEESTGDADDVPPAIMDRIKEASAETSFRIVSIVVNEEKTAATVECLLKVPGLEKEVPKTLGLLLEGSTALVDSIE